MDKNRRSVSKMADTSKNRNRNPEGYSTLPVRYFAQCLGVSAATANNFKKCAQASGWISVKRQIASLYDSADNQICKDAYCVFLHAESGITPILQIKKKYLKIVECDLIKSNIVCGKKRFKNGEKM